MARDMLDRSKWSEAEWNEIVNNKDTQQRQEGEHAGLVGIGSGTDIANHYGAAKPVQEEGHARTSRDESDWEARTQHASSNGSAIPDSQRHEKTNGDGGEKYARSTKDNSHPKGAEHDREGKEQEGQHSKDLENEDEDEHTSLKPVGFWDKSLDKVRREVLIGWSRTVLILMAFILTILSLYWAVLFHVEENLEALTVAVVSFDGQFAPYAGTTPVVGQAVEAAARMQMQKRGGVLGYVIKSPADYDNNPLAVRQAVYDEHLWAAIIVSNNASALLQQAVETGNRNYDPLGAAQIIYNEARDETTYDNYIIPLLNQMQVQISSTFGEQWVERVLSNPSLDPAIYRRAPQALSPAIGFSIFNLRPFHPPTATPAVTIGLIYLIIIAFFSFSFFLPIHTKFILPQGHPPMHFWELIIWRWAATVISYLLLSLAYSLVSLAFQIPFSNTLPRTDVSVISNADAFGKGTFPVYWMINFFGMFALGMASENVTMVIGQPWTALWLIFWVITNVSTSFYTIPLAPRFFYWGYAWPLHHIVYASRTILFDTHSKLGLNFGVLLAWCAINTALFPICCLFMRYKSSQEQLKERHERVPKIKYLVDG